MLRSHAVGERTASAPAHLRLAERLAFDGNKRGPVLPEHPNFGGGRLGLMLEAAAPEPTDTAGGAGLIITLITSSGTFAAFRTFEAFNAGVKRETVLTGYRYESWR